MNKRRGVKVKFPIAKVQSKDRLSFCLALKEALRQEHNIKGTQFRNKEITEKAWLTYYISFMTRHGGVTEKILALRKQVAFEELATINLKDSFENVS